MKIIDNSQKPKLPPPNQNDIPRTEGLMGVLEDIILERGRQDAKWGEQNHPSFYQQEHWQGLQFMGTKDIPIESRATFYGIQTEEDAKEDCEKTFKKGKGNWGHIFLEEVSETFHAKTEEELETELIQTLAVGAAWLECIRRNRRKQS